MPAHAVTSAVLWCSYIEESNADKAIKALTSALAPRAKALRDGEVKQIEAVELVPGVCHLCKPLAEQQSASAVSILWPVLLLLSSAYGPCLRAVC